MKLCPSCKTEKEESEFYVGKKRLSSYCKLCFRAYKVSWLKKNPEKTKIYDRKNNLKTAYGISLDEYDALVVKQGGRCAICKKETFLYVDHDHKTGKLRGLLCSNCNVGIGNLQDSTQIIADAYRYLLDHGEPFIQRRFELYAVPVVADNA